VPHAVGIIGEIATPGAPEFARAQDPSDPFRGWLLHVEPAIPQSFDRLQRHPALFRNHGVPQWGADPPFDLRSQVVRGDEIRQHFGADRQLGGDVAAFSIRGNDDARHHGLRVVEHGDARGCLHGLLHQSGRPQRRHLVGPQ
jgi:hypothetical protein